MGQNQAEVKSTRQNAIRHFEPDRLAQAWLVPRWMTTSPARTSTCTQSAQSNMRVKEVDPYTIKILTPTPI